MKRGRAEMSDEALRTLLRDADPGRDSAPARPERVAALRERLRGAARAADAPVSTWRPARRALAASLLLVALAFVAAAALVVERSARRPHTEKGREAPLVASDALRAPRADAPAPSPRVEPGTPRVAGPSGDSSAQAHASVPAGATERAEEAMTRAGASESRAHEEQRVARGEAAGTAGSAAAPGARRLSQLKELRFTLPSGTRVVWIFRGDEQDGSQEGPASRS